MGHIALNLPKPKPKPPTKIETITKAKQQSKNNKNTHTHTPQEQQQDQKSMTPFEFNRQNRNVDHKPAPWRPPKNRGLRSIRFLTRNIDHKPRLLEKNPLSAVSRGYIDHKPKPPKPPPNFTKSALRGVRWWILMVYFFPCQNPYFFRMGGVCRS